MIYVYPAVFTYHPEEKGCCFTGGDDLKEALLMADDVLNLCLWDLEYDGKEIPPASRLEDLEKPEHGFLIYMLADTEAYTPAMIKANPQMNIDPSRIKKEPERDRLTA